MPAAKPSLASRIEALNATVRDFKKVQPSGRILFYGDSGTGKSVLSIRLAQRITPPDKRILYVDSSEGWASLMNHPANLRHRVTPVVYEGWSQLETIIDAIKWAEANPGKLKQWEGIGCLVVDEFSVMVRNELNTVTYARANAPEGIRDGKDPYASAWPDQRHVTHKTSIMERAFLDLGRHTIFTCHERIDKDKNNVTKSTMSLMKETREYVKEPLHLVARVTSDIVSGASDAGNLYKRSVQCHPSKTVDAKSRIGNLKISESFGPLIDKIDAWLKSGSTEVDEAEEIVTPEEASNLTGALIADD